MTPNPPSSPFNSILERGRKSIRISSLFFSTSSETNFSRFRRTLSTGFDCWLCYGSEVEVDRDRLVTFVAVGDGAASDTDIATHNLLVIS